MAYFLLNGVAPLHPVQRVRDECVTLHGPEAKECQDLIEAHKACLRAEGFNVRGLVNRGVGVSGGGVKYESPGPVEARVV